jgi:nitrite reductase/ring-hydroxylating ferredoxin subunit
MSSSVPFPYPPELQAPGSAAASFVPTFALAELPRGSLRRFTRGDLDVLLAHTEAGIVATDDRCPHMSAPFSAGRLEGCTLHCPLHRGAFDLRSGDVVTFPTTGGLTADGESRATWTPEGTEPKPVPSGPKAQARALTRVRRLRYYPVRLRDGAIEVALPE